VLVDTGDSMAARTVAALDTNLVVAGLSRYIRVFDPGIFEPTAQSDDELADRHDAMREGDAVAVDDWRDDRLTCEVGGYIVRARRSDAWDAVVALLVALEAEHHHAFHALMQQCRLLSNSRPEMGGLDERLMAPEQHLYDVTIEREQRRARRGYATPADARAFLQMVRQRRATSPPIATNPIVTAYFRAAEDEPDGAQGRTHADASTTAAHDDVTDSSSRGSDDPPQSIDAVIELLAEAGLMPDRPRALLEGGDADPHAGKVALLRRLMKFALHKNEAAYLSRTRELAFLANALLAGSSIQSRPFTPAEASDAAACICNLGLECWPQRWLGAASPFDSTDPPEAFLVDHDLLTTFEAGWSMLYQDVSLFVADQLIGTLAELRCGDVDTRLGIESLRRSLVRGLEAGTPWLARDSADVLATLDLTAWIGVLGLIDECPILPAALTAVVERRTKAVSPTAFEFISTTAQIGDIRLFMRSLSSVLSS